MNNTTEILLEELLENIEEDLSFVKESFNKKNILSKIERFEEKINSSDFWQDKDNAQIILKEYNLLRNRYNKISDLIARFEDLKILYEFTLSANDDSDLKEYRQEANLIKDIVYEEKIKALFANVDDLTNAYMEIHAGSGGLDSQDFASMILRMYIRWAEKHNFNVGDVDISKGEAAGIKSAVIKISGEYAYGYLRSEAGVHRLIRQSPFNSDGKRHTSFISVSIYPEVDSDINIKIDQKDLRIDTFRAAGAGGQHVNTTDSAVRITHVPTGIVVQCQSERSQHRNKDTAMSLLKAKLYTYELQKQEKIKQNSYQAKQAIDFGSQIRSYVLHPYAMVKDHRSATEHFNPKEVLDGDLDSFIFAFLAKNL